MVFRECDVRYEVYGFGPGGGMRERYVEATHGPTGIKAKAWVGSIAKSKAVAAATIRGRLACGLAERQANRKPVRTYYADGILDGVVDHRTGVRVGVDALRRGKIDGLIAAYLAAEAA